jgi:hypothetical protein
MKGSRLFTLPTRLVLDISNKYFVFRLAALKANTRDLERPCS